MADQLGREARDQLRHRGEVGDPGGHDHLLGAELLAVVETQPEAPTVAGHVGHARLLEVGHVAPLEVQAVLHEGGEGNGLVRGVVGQVVLEAVVGQGGARVRGRQVRGEPVRLQEHPARHRRTPGVQGAPEDAEVGSPPVQVRRDGQPVRPRSDDGGVTLVHHGKLLGLDRRTSDRGCSGVASRACGFPRPLGTTLGDRVVAEPPTALANPSIGYEPRTAILRLRSPRGRVVGSRPLGRSGRSVLRARRRRGAAPLMPAARGLSRKQAASATSSRVTTGHPGGSPPRTGREPRGRLPWSAPIGRPRTAPTRGSAC